MELSDEQRTRYYLIGFVIALLFDLAIITYAIISQNVFLLIGILILAVLGGLLLLNMWNYDERTEKALQLASRDTVRIFIGFTSILAIGILIYSWLNDFILWEVGATLAASSLVLIYLQGLSSVIYEVKFR